MEVMLHIVVYRKDDQKLKRKISVAKSVATDILIDGEFIVENK
jgi:hypothetical protein